MDSSEKADSKFTPDSPARRLIATLEQRFLNSRMSQSSVVLLLGVLVGVVAGLGAVAFRWMIQQTTGLFFDYGASLFHGLGDYHTVLLPAIGGAIVGPFIYLVGSEARGSRVPKAMDAVFRLGGRMRARVAPARALASAICIGSGGSVGREGPIAHIGAALGSLAGQLLRLSQTRTRTLVACGAAAGVAATFNAPIAGAFFALEVIVAEWTAEAFAPVVVSAVVGSVIGRTFFGDVPSFAVPEYGMTTFGELPLFALLGIAAAVVGIALIVVLFRAEDLFSALPIPVYLLPVIGGLIVGFIGLYHSQLYRVGYDMIEQILLGHQTDLAFLAGLLGLKIIATSATLGSGGSGGVFSPSLFLGAALGAILGTVFGDLFPNLASTPGAYAIAGMGAVFAATSHAPICAIMFGFELTRDYRLILPLMLACGVSVVIAKALYRFSIYNLALFRRGIHIELGRDAQLLNQITIGEAMTTDVITVTPQTPVRDIAHMFDETKHHGFPVVDEQGKLHGCVALEDVHRTGPDGLDQPVDEIATHDLIIAFPDESINDGLRKLGLRDVGRIPVVSRDDHTRLLGLLTRKNIISAYNQALMRHHTHLEETETEEHFD